MSHAALAQTETFDSLVSTTLKNIQPTFQAQIYPMVPLLNHFQTTGKKVMLDGGLQIAVGVVGDDSPNFEWYTGSTVASDDEADPLTRALYNWAVCRDAVKISDFDLDINSGKSQIANLLTELVENVKRSMANQIDIRLNNDADDSSQIMGIGDFIKESTGVTVGGLSPSTNDYWENQRITSGVTFHASAALPGNLVQAGLLPLYNRCILRVPPVDRGGIIFVTTQDIFQGYELSLENIAQVMLTDTQKSSLGFGQADDMLTYKKKPFMWSASAPAEEVKLVNTNYLKMYVHSKRDFAWDAERTYANAHASIRYCRFMAQLGTNFRYAQGGLFNVVADT